MSEQPVKRAADIAAAWLASLGQRPVGIPIAPEDLRSRLDATLGDTGEDPGVMISELAAALAADWLASAFDQNAAMYVMSPAAAVVEEITAEWLLDLFGLPRQSGVGF